MLAKREERTGLRGRLDRAQAALTEANDRSYRHALQIHHAANNALENIEQTVDGTRPRDATHLIAAMIVLYHQDTRSIGLEASYSGTGNSVSPHFLHFAINRLPEGPASTPLKAMLSDALRYWRIRNPTKVIQPTDNGTGKAITSATRPGC